MSITKLKWIRTPKTIVSAPSQAQPRTLAGRVIVGMFTHDEAAEPTGRDRDAILTSAKDHRRRAR